MTNTRMKNNTRRASRFHLLFCSLPIAVAMALVVLSSGAQRAFAADPGIKTNTVEVVPYQSSGYRYNVVDLATQTTQPNVGFEQPEFDDAAWSEGQAAFGSEGGACPLQDTAVSSWPVKNEIYIRRKVTIPAGATKIRIMAVADNDLLAYFDGIPLGPVITHENCPSRDEYRLDVDTYAGTVAAGEHTLAFYVKDRGIESFFDMRLLVDVTVPKGLTLATDKTSICAGGWNDGLKAYVYLEKESGNIVAREKKPNQSEPHIATLTATLGDDEGRPISGKTVTFSWDMPGPAPAETRTATTDAKGEAKVDVISGDELSKDFDEETGQSLFDNPVEVKATYLEMEKSKSLNVVAPTIEWQYKNESGTYAKWNGEVWGLYSAANDTSEIPLRALLTFDKKPVVGHAVGWGIDTIYDKGGAEVTPGDADTPDDEGYSTYGSMSGESSTSAANGGATATFTRGYNAGQLVFAINDTSVFTQEVSSETPTSSTEPTAASTQGVQPSAQSTATATGANTPSGRRTSKGTYETIKVGEYRHVQGPADASNYFAYPAPSGEEDNELLQKSRDYVRAHLPGIESKTGKRQQNLADLLPVLPSSSRAQRGDWWFSQIVGNDQESKGTHLADFTVTTTTLKPNTLIPKTTTRYYSAAFDIVLVGVSIFETDGRRDEFGPYVKAMRDHGIVAWHRWRGEPGVSENEMHCIDPATPIIKEKLRDQIDDFRFNKGTGGGYPTGDFPITKWQTDQVTTRYGNKLSVPNAKPDNP